MAKILQLDPHVADLIAAGEVVERPASVVKELIENAIDAGANAVTVEIRGGGTTYIRVSDNGCGIAPGDTETAFLRHATSKLRDANGLEAISTLGFRGEALAAIAAVARVELLTKETGASEGTSLSLEGGTVTSKSPAGCPDGTTMIVRDLFFNTPARLKFMKSDRAEGAGVSSTVLCCALSHPEISIKYIKDGKTEYHTPGDGRTDSCIYSLFGRDFAMGLLEAGTSDEYVAVTGYVSSPASAKGNRSAQYFFVNGRYVRSKTLQAALEQAYRNSLFTGRFPSCVLYVTLSPGAVDVNVHPTKTEVKFLFERQVFSGVYYAALGALEGETKKAEIKLPAETQAFPSGKPLIPDEPPVRATPQSGSYQKMTPESFRGNNGGGFISRVQAVPEKPAAETLHDAVRPVYRAQNAPVFENADLEPEIAGMSSEDEYRIVGEAMGTYIVVERKDSLWLIDKHAAHERINFDRLKAEKQVTMSQTLIAPVICETGREDAELLLENGDMLESLGFLVESFGEAAVAIRQIPSEIDVGDAEATLGELCADLRQGGKGDAVSKRDTLLHTIACKAAIKAGRRSDRMELEALVRRVVSGEIRYCPHGRPVAMEITKSTLDRNFKRT